jgi:hypothetical protein
MRGLFVAFDRHRYAGMGCWPCHRRELDRRIVDFRMPNPDLLLDPDHCAEGVAQSSPPHAQAAAQRMHRFMAEQVTPEMARLLGRSAASFGCFDCHVEDR